MFRMGALGILRNTFGCKSFNKASTQGVIHGRIKENGRLKKKEATAGLPNTLSQRE
jgi:hypothetical protein